MNRTYTPSLPPGVLPRLEAYAELFRPDFPLARQADWSLVYLRGLLQDGERKSIEPLVGRVDLPPQLRLKNPDQCLQNFVNQADSGYGVSKAFRDGLSERGLGYVVGVTGDMVVFTEQPCWIEPEPSRGGRPRTRRRLAEDAPRPASLEELASRLPRQEVTWRRGTKGDLTGKFSWTRAWPAQGWATGDCAGADPIWLLIEEQADGTIKYAYSNLPAETPRERAVLLWRSRWPVEQGYQQMKEELGLDHFEGRSWRGFHHHACLVMLAFGFLALERLRVEPVPASPGKKGVPGR